MIIRRQAKNTLTALEVDHGDRVEFTLLDGTVRVITLEDTGAEIISTTLKKPGVEEPGGRTIYRFWSRLRVGDAPVLIEREVGTQRSFYEPAVVDGVRIWLDAVDAIFGFMRETHSPCRTQEQCSHHLPARRQARIAIQDATARICPDRLHAWCPLPPGELRIEQCYRGEDCWLGAYDGASAHGGLDINHPKGTPLFAPLDLDDHFCYHRVETGANNNRWRGVRHWADGAVWILQSCHMTKLTVAEHRPLHGGRQYAEGAGVRVGCVEHSHFAFSVFDAGELIRLDPWILFWQMYQDQESDAAMPMPGSARP